MLKKITLAGGIVVALCLASTGAWAQDGEWQVRKSSGDVWVASSGAQQVALTPAAVLRPGDQIRTGKNGRTLLVRGDETILISPNSVIGLPKEPSKGLTTTIIQERGSILLEVEKRSEKHFEVETPYLVAVVKGTEFRVSVDGRESRVEVLAGQVEVAELKTGKFALVSPGQVARVASNGAGGLSLSGRGAIDEIKQGTPRAPRANPGVLQRDVRANDNARSNGNAAQALRIRSTLGEVKLDFPKVTKGIAQNSTAALSSNGGANGRAGNAGADNNGSGNGLGDGNANSLGNGGGNAFGNGGGNAGGNAFGNGGGTAAAGLGNGLGGVLGNGGCTGKGKGKGSSC
jgi:hypothetical protein